MKTFEVGQKVTRNIYYLLEAFPHAAQWSHSVINTWLVGNVVKVEGRNVYVQWTGEEWEKAGPLSYRDWQLDHVVEGQDFKILEDQDILENPHFDIADLPFEPMMEF